MASETSHSEKAEIHAAFVLAGAEAAPPKAEAVLRAAADVGLDGLSIHETGQEQALAFRSPNGSFVLQYIGTPHPEAKAVERGPFSPTDEAVAESQAHLVIALVAHRGTTIEGDRRVAAFAAAVALATRAAAAMIGSGRQFVSTPNFVKAVVEAGQESVPVPGLVDFTLAGEPGGLASVLSHGLVRYGHEEVLVISKSAESELEAALDFAASIATYILTANPELKDGETIGRTDDEKIGIERLRHPADEAQHVIRLDLSELPLPAIN